MELEARRFLLRCHANTIYEWRVASGRELSRRRSNRRFLAHVHWLRLYARDFLFSIFFFFFFFVKLWGHMRRRYIGALWNARNVRWLEDTLTKVGNFCFPIVERVCVLAWIWQGYRVRKLWERDSMWNDRRRDFRFCTRRRISFCRIENLFRGIENSLCG